MSLSLGLAVLVSVQAAAPTNEPWVVLMRRSGVAAPKAMEVAKAVASQLGNSGIPTGLEVDDVSKCNGKKPCLIALGRKKQVPAMVLVEVGTVLDEAFARAEAISLEEDGKRIGVAEVEGTLESLTESLKARVSVSLVPPLRTLLGLAAPVEVVKETPPVKPEPVSEVPPPMPPVEQPVVLVAPAPEPQSKPFFTGGRIAGLVIAGAGAGTLIASGVFGGIAGGAAKDQTSLCPAGTQCTNPAAFTAYNNAAGAQNTSLVLMGVGVGLAAVGVVVMLIPSGNSETPPAAVTMLPVPGGMAASVSGAF